MTELFATARAGQGNILIPAFTVGRTQDLLCLMSKNVQEWGLDDWQVFVDSPMGIEATNTYSRYRTLYGARLFKPGSNLPNLPNITMTLSTEESMTINPIKSGAIIIAGSGMCSGGLSAHADQADLIDWYGAFDGHPPVYLVHGEKRSQKPLAEKLRSKFNAAVTIARRGQTIDIG